jgi:(p)ppGpp synthase/HD superfamily hydrolase
VNAYETAVALWNQNHFVGVSDINMARFGRAYHFSLTNHAEKKRKSKQSFFIHDCRTAHRILKTKLPFELAIVMLMHEAKEDDGWTDEMLTDLLGEEIALAVHYLSKLPKTEFKNRRGRLNSHIVTLDSAVEQGIWWVPFAKLDDRFDNDTDTAGLGKIHSRRLFRETRSDFIPYFNRSRRIIPVEHLTAYDLWLFEVENACANYERSLALQK